MIPSIIETPGDAALLNLTSPSFHMRYPELSHRELIADDVLHAMEASWNVHSFPERPITLSLLKNVYVVEEGLVFDGAGNLYDGSITQHSPPEIDRGYAAVQAAMRSDDVHVVRDRAVLCKKRGAYNYGHWLIEMLPKAYLAKLYLGQDPLCYLVPSAESPLRQVISDSLSMLNIDASSVISLGQEPVHVDSLLLVEGLSHHGVFMSPLIMNCMDGLSARVPGRGIAKLFVTRAGTNVRRFVNEDEVAAKAQECGYTLIDPGAMSLADQIGAFKNAREIAGVMGAAMTNIAFAPRDACIVDLAPAAMPDTFFWFIAGLRGQSYCEIRCEQTGPLRGVAPWDTDLVFSRDDLSHVFRGGG